MNDGPMDYMWKEMYDGQCVHNKYETLVVLT